MSWPSNLTPRAAEDLVGILRYTAKTFGDPQADATEAMIIAQCKRVEDGHDLGHSRDDLQKDQKRSVKFIVVQRMPFVIAYNPKTRKVIRIVHGRRNFLQIFGATSR